VDKQGIIEKLRECYDPEIPHVSIVDLGLIYDVRVNGSTVEIDMTLTAPGCPMSQPMAQEARRKVEELAGINEAIVNIVWEPPWTPDRITEDGKKALGWTS
jgi:metal-sulfur cluster biosynthetic enzyme